MGYSPLQRLLKVELPLALPSIVAGVRIAAVTTIGLVTIATLIGLGGLGALIYTGLLRDFSTPAVVGLGALGRACGARRRRAAGRQQRHALGAPPARGEGRA